MHTSRRSFLQTLGIAAAGIAFAPSILKKCLWRIPEDIVYCDGPATLEWMLAATVAEIARNLPADQICRASRFGLVGPSRQFGISFEFDPTRGLSRREVHEGWIKPAGAQLAQEIRDGGHHVCFPMSLPNAVEYCGRIAHERSGLDLRFARAFDIGGEYEYEIEDGDGNVIGTETRISPPRWCNRFDMLVA